MKIYSQKARSNDKPLIKNAQGFMPLHHTDESFNSSYYGNNYPDISARQQSMLDIVMRNTGNGNYVSSPLMQIILNTQGVNNMFTSKADRSLLIQAWENGSNIDKAENKDGNRIALPSTFNPDNLIRLKQAGLVVEQKGGLYLTPSGKETLVQYFLNEGECPEKKAANGMERLIKSAVGTGRKIVRRRGVVTPMPGDADKEWNEKIYENLDSAEGDVEERHRDGDSDAGSPGAPDNNAGRPSNVTPDGKSPVTRNIETQAPKPQSKVTLPVSHRGRRTNVVTNPNGGFMIAENRGNLK